jgi:hypothetical protein
MLPSSINYRYTCYYKLTHRSQTVYDLHVWYLYVI